MKERIEDRFLLLQLPTLFGLQNTYRKYNELTRVFTIRCYGLPEAFKEYSKFTGVSKGWHEGVLVFL